MSLRPVAAMLRRVTVTRQYAEDVGSGECMNDGAEAETAKARA